MGRKRTSNKRPVKLSVDNDVLDKLIELNINKSVLFTEAAEKIIKELSKENNSKKVNN